MLKRIPTHVILFTAFVLSTSPVFSDSCGIDPQECTPKNLCEMTTEIQGGQKVWTSKTEMSKHISFAKQLGMDCGASDPKDPCDLDANACKISELCERATTGEDSKKWNLDNPDHVRLAKRYSLSCDVSETAKKEKPDNFAHWSDELVCRFIKDKNKEIHRQEAKKRGLNCQSITSRKIFNSWSDHLICKYVKEKGMSVHIREAERRGIQCERSNVPNDDLAASFRLQDQLKRKQIQYALMILGHYEKEVDGLWGKGTKNALASFASAEGLGNTTSSNIFSKLLSRVSVPSSFAGSEQNDNKSNFKKNESHDNKNEKVTNNGWAKLNSNPKLPFDDAKEICEAKAEAEGKAYLTANRPRDRFSSVNCTGYGFNSYSCRQSPGGGAAGSFLRAWDNVENRSAAKKLAQAVAKACMADYGWIKR